MAERVNTIKRGGSRFYVDPATGVKHPGVTSILSMLPKPFLGPWQAKVAAQYAVDHAPELLQLALKDPAAAVDVIKAAPRRYTTGRAELGTRGHELFETMAKGEKPRTVPSDLAGMHRAFGEFLDRWQPVFENLEYSVWDDTVGYAGSADACCVIEGETVVLDLKTGREVYADVGLQLAAYARAEFVLSETGVRTANYETTGGAVLHVPADGDGRWSLLPVACGVEQFEVFKLLRGVFEYDAVGKRGIVGKPL